MVISQRSVNSGRLLVVSAGTEVSDVPQVSTQSGSDGPQLSVAGGQLAAEKMPNLARKINPQSAIRNPQSQLYRAAWLSGDAARAAWREARAALDLENLPAEVFPLLPQLYLNLCRLAIDDAWRPRLKGIYRQTWSSNQLRLPHLARLGAMLNAPLLLPGPTWLVQHYGDAGLCAVNRCDVWLAGPPDAGALTAAGWRQGSGGAAWTSFHRDAEDIMLGCHWWRWDDVRAATCAADAPLGGAWRILSPTDALIYLAGDAAGVDVWAVWQTRAALETGRTDWARLADALRNPTHAAKMLEMLDLLDAEIPAATRATLSYQAAGGVQAGARARLRRAWHLLRQDYQQSDRAALDYLLARWGLAAARQLPAAGLRRLLRLCRRTPSA